MDNLGIIKVLAQALSGLNGKNKGENGGSGVNFGGILDAFKNLNLNKNPTQNSPSTTTNSSDISPTENSANNSKKSTPTPANLPPLQSNMLSVMSNHDKLIKRVLENNPSN